MSPFLLLAALVPAVFLMVQVYRLDRIEKEPPGLLLKLVLFDAVVYCVFAALGFAALENILYVAQFGFAVAVSRALLSVPGHCFFAVYMGIYLGQAKMVERAMQRYYIELPDEMPEQYLRASLLVPTLLHGFWDFSLSVGGGLMTALFYLFVLAFFVDAYRKLRFAAGSDERL